ncbi:MAG: hypothetical protein MPJ50_06685 [Pirellulales bacterium]|nr:hypothetical protein [Pirellulales bacterium]
MEFQERLQKAIERGSRTRDERTREKQAKALSVEELRRLHSEFRLPLSERIEFCLKQLAAQFPGFEYAGVLDDERGWGGSISRDDVEITRAHGRRKLFSRLEMTVRPFGSHHVLDLAAKGTVRNKEIFNRNHFQRLTEVDLDSFMEMIDIWSLEYAELYAAKG